MRNRRLSIAISQYYIGFLIYLFILTFQSINLLILQVLFIFCLSGYAIF